MATATLVIDVGQKVTCSSSANKVRQVSLPIGTMAIKMSSTASFYLDFAATADEGSETANSQFLYLPGTYFEPLWGLGGRSVNATRALRYLYVIGASTSQVVYFHAVSRY